ncbi:protein-tyrosine phosphatase-like protein [Fimicolochytrium jonesii]|uniref:protein-tyrosine phosphatase-like protein n=1 Tax=Fimicolochytrium jonesii TaxID=1396493 RepID=UPI0022FE679C|nr:protein-tyrosine phosphatase-like protein [Fimicolochytrium jonesii]KAI8819665.1 protein-tyrosine phosphatase-like protein [Fimicolochytrium jonesii]
MPPALPAPASRLSALSALRSKILPPALTHPATTSSPTTPTIKSRRTALLTHYPPSIDVTKLAAQDHRFRALPLVDQWKQAQAEREERLTARGKAVRVSVVTGMAKKPEGSGGVKKKKKKLGPAQDANILQAQSVTHVLSLGLNQSYPSDGLIRHIVELEDSDTADILSHLPDACKFIDDARTEEKTVLVHCVAGVSRSAAVVIAYLMKTRKMDLKSAFAFVMAVRPSIGPNEGFMHQLQLWEAMNCELDPAYPGYRMFRMKQMAKARLEGRAEGSMPGFDQSPTAVSDLSAPGSNRTLRCRKCRMTLATGPQIMSHQPDSQSIAKLMTRRSKTHPSNPPLQPQCSSYYIEPVSWIPGVNGDAIDNPYATEGKVSCPNPQCSAKLGAWNWAGVNCSCGTWVSPAFTLQKSKVDEIVRR